MRSVRHGTGVNVGGEFTLCGLACDAFESGDADKPVTFAAPGEIVTCKECRDVIYHVKTFRGYRAP